MARIKLIWIIVGLAATAIFFLLFLSRRQSNDVQIPSLLGRHLRFDDKLIEQTWKGIAAQGDLARVFYRDPGNRYLPVQSVNCRVKYQGVSYQALLAPAGSQIVLELKAQKGNQLNFSIFNPKAKILKFLVKTGSPGKETLLFRQSLFKQMVKVAVSDLPYVGKKTLRLILETQGDGMGAWINPCILQRRPRPRTVLMLMLDTLRADHVSAYGYRRLTTPAFDGLAKGSLLFSRAFSTSSWTLPAHVSLFSGRDVLGHGVVSPHSLIPTDLPLLAEMMQGKGFVTLALTGGGFVDDHFGFFRGFQTYANRPKDIFEREAAGFLYQTFLDKVADFSSQDLFVFLHTYQMHAPYKAPPLYYRAFNPELDTTIKKVGSSLHLPRELFRALPSADRQKIIDLYDASILYSDQELLKPLLAYLRSSNRFDDAMLIVLSDHGEEFYDHGSWEHGHTLYQELTHIPLIIKMPRQKRGEIRRQLVSICDVAGLIQAECGFGTDVFGISSGRVYSHERVLELSLPLVPTHKGLFGRVSFIKNDQQYIHNFLPALATWNGFVPPPVLSSDEWFTLADPPAAAAKLFSPIPGFNFRYKKMLADYLRRLKALNNNNGPLDQELMEKLKALGYLNN